MAVLFFGGELSSVIPANSLAFEDTTAGAFDATYSRCALATTGPYGTASTPTWTAAPTFWFHCLLAATYGYPNNPSGALLLMYAGSTVVAQLVIVAGITTFTLQLQTLQAGVMTNVGSAQTLNSTQTGSSTFYRYTIDLNVVAGAAGLATFFLNGSAVAAATGLGHSAWAGVTSVTLAGTMDAFTNYQTTAWWSQMIADSSNTLGRYLITDQPTNESATNTGWTGAGGASKLADINDTPAVDDTTYIQSATTGQIDTFYQSGLNLTGYYILGRGVAARARVNDGSGVNNLKLALRDASANYTSPAYSLSTGFAPIMYMWTADPATGSIWTSTAAAAVEFGVQSQT